MRRIFGASKPVAPPPSLNEAGDRLNSRGERLEEQIKKLDAQLMQFREQLKKTRPGPAQDAIKRRAMTVLRQKKMYEGQRETLYNQQMNMEQTRFAVESIQDTVQTVQALKGAAQEMKTTMKINKELNLSFMENLRDELEDMADVTTEINEMMGQSFAIPEDVDESELMAELDGLEYEMMQEPATGAAVPSYLQETELPELPSAAHNAAPAEPIAQRF